MADGVHDGWEILSIETGSSLQYLRGAINWDYRDKEFVFEPVEDRSYFAAELAEILGFIQEKNQAESAKLAAKKE